MKHYDEVIDAIQRGDMDISEFEIWLADYYNQAYRDGYNDYREDESLSN